MFCDGLHDWLLVRSGSETLLASLVARRWVGPRALWRCHHGPNLVVAVAKGSSECNRFKIIYFFSYREEQNFSIPSLLQE